jgi:metallophosphoesterase (TIGR00282 family)
MLKILFIGDIYGKLGRETLRKLLPKIKREHKPDFIIANAENVAHGSGITEITMNEIFDLGVDCITLGDHAFDRPKDAKDCLNSGMNIIRPANLPDQNTGKGLITIEKNGHIYTIINLLGRVNMPFCYDCPFKKLDLLLNELKLANIKSSAIIVDIHAETTAEKICFGHFADSKVTAVLGTHTHIPTADARLLPKGTAYITDTGMTGAYNESLGLGLENAIKTLIDQTKHSRVTPDKGAVQLNCVLIEVDGKKAKPKSVKQMTYLSEIK